MARWDLGRRTIRSLSVALAFGLAVALVGGCGGGLKTYPVQGKLVFEKGDIKLLAGSTVICQQQETPFLQANGEIGDDGSFTLQTYSKGEIAAGAAEGTYRAWIQLSSEKGSPDRQFKKIGIDPTFLDGKSSTLSFKVPADKEVVLTVTRAKPGAKLIAQPDRPALQQKCGEDDAAASDDGTPGQDDNALGP